MSMNIEIARNLVSFATEEGHFLAYWKEITKIDPAVFISEAEKKFDEAVGSVPGNKSTLYECFNDSYPVEVFVLGFLIGAKVQQQIKEKV